MLPEIVTPIPGPRSRELAAKLARYEAREVTWLTDDFPIFWERAERSNVWDVDGNRFLDFTSAFAVCGLGHSSPVVRDPLMRQAGRLLHAMGDVHPAGVKADLCEALSRVTYERWGAGTGRTILCNSGSEAVEAALKTALLWSGRPGVMAFTGGYHGLGHGALAAGGMPFFQEPFQAQLGRFGVTVPFPRGTVRGGTVDADGFPSCDDQELEALEAEIIRTLRSRPIGAILVEPVQGRGGEVVPPRAFLGMLRRICDAENVLLILDEIYTGFNRTGRLFACEYSGVVPDLVCLGKALTGGFPLAACVGRAGVMDAWPVSRGEALHTSTMLGNPLGCAMALAAIGEHEKPETQHLARETGRRLRAALLGLRSPQIAEVRGLGTMLGIALLRTDGSPYGELAGSVMVRGLQNGLILLGGGPDGNVLSFSPPFGLTDDEIACLVSFLQEVLE